VVALEQEDVEEKVVLEEKIRKRDERRFVWTPLLSLVFAGFFFFFLKTKQKTNFSTFLAFFSPYVVVEVTVLQVDLEVTHNMIAMAAQEEMEEMEEMEDEEAEEAGVEMVALEAMQVASLYLSPTPLLLWL
jgi:hypothetical protein